MKGIHDYDAIMKGVKRRIQDELSPENVELISQYDMEMIRQSIAIATRQKHLRTLLGLSRILQKDMAHVEGFKEWYIKKQEWMISDSVCKFFADLRAVVYHRHTCVKQVN